MTDEDGRDLSRRLHWDAGRGLEPDADAVPEPGAQRRGDEVGWADDEESGTGYFATGTASGRSFERRDLDRMEADALDRRRQLWRDTALLLSGLVAALLVANLVLPQIAGIAAASPSPFASGAGPGGSAPGLAGPSQEPVVDPSTGAGATRAPTITLPPTGTHAPSTPRPARTPRPTRIPPTAPPTEAPTPEITPEPTPEITPEITPEPPPTPVETPPDPPTPGP